MRFSMNSSGRLDSLRDAFIKNAITFTLGVTINCINGVFVYIYFESQVFQRDPRYILFIHLVINDMIMLTFSVVLHVLTYTIRALGFIPCSIIIIILNTTNGNSPMNLAGMAVERYIAVCHPLHHVQICTVQRAHVLIALIWGISLIPSFTNIIILFNTKPLSAILQPVPCYPSFLFNTQHHKVHRLFVQVFGFSFVFLTLVITYLKVFCAAQAVSGSNRDSTRNARNTILLHGVQLLICMLSFISPFVNLHLVTLWPKKRTTILFNSYLLTNVLPRLLSPLIYGVRDKKFSSHIRLHFCSKCCNTAGKNVNNMTELQRRPKNILH
ncbi:odorant receptor 131-2-like [Notolabrus celidotus]|uniref:odorant receptor 131-2-like n=1 Tax=Notolabrus celidotus TaxID=1203425 RepID=UPI0014904AB1|nr:odorant receptor 131-2-like [Notolabrus celidotus]